MAPHRPESLPRYPQVSVFRFQVSGFRFQVSGFRFQVSGLRLLQYLGVRNPDRQDKHPWYVVSVGSILNQPRLYSLGHHHSDLPEISFLLFPALTPVDVPTVLQLSCGDSRSSLGCFRASRSTAMQSAPPFSFQSRLTASVTSPCFCATKRLMFVGVFHELLSFRFSVACMRLY